MADVALTKSVGVAVGAMVFAIVAYVCLGRTRYVQQLAVRWRDLTEPSWELTFLRSAAYLWMVRFVGVLSTLGALILLWVLYRRLAG